MTFHDDMDDVRNRHDSVERADRFLASPSDGGGADPGWVELAPLLDATRQPATAEELVGAEATIEAFTIALHATERGSNGARKHVLGKVLTGKAVAGLAAVSLIAAGTAAAASSHLLNANRGTPTVDVRDVGEDGPPSTATTVANAEADPTTTTTTTSVLQTTTLAAAPAADDEGEGSGPDANGPAKHGLCTAFKASQDHKGKNLDATAFKNLVQAAADAGRTVDEFCADVTATTENSGGGEDTGDDASETESTEPAGHGDQGDSSKPGDQGQQQGDHLGDGYHPGDGDHHQASTGSTEAHDQVPGHDG